jgi:hypothetical protein
MQTSPRVLNHLANQISAGHALWALYSANQSVGDSQLKEALVAKAKLALKDMVYEPKEELLVSTILSGKLSNGKTTRINHQISNLDRKLAQRAIQNSPKPRMQIKKVLNSEILTKRLLRRSCECGIRRTIGCNYATL